MVRDDVITDAGMDGERNAETISVPENRKMFPGMAHFMATAFEVVLAHGAEQLRAGRAERVRRFAAKSGLQFFGRGERDAILLDEAAERGAVAFPAQAARQ